MVGVAGSNPASRTNFPMEMAASYRPSLTRMARQSLASFTKVCGRIKFPPHHQFDPHHVGCTSSGREKILDGGEDLPAAGTSQQLAQMLALAHHNHHLANRVPLRRWFTGREMLPVPDRMALLPELFEGVVFDDGLVEAHLV